jgi:hypothetical protein
MPLVNAHCNGSGFSRPRSVDIHVCKFFVTIKIHGKYHPFWRRDDDINGNRCFPFCQSDGLSVAMQQPAILLHLREAEEIKFPSWKMGDSFHCQLKKLVPVLVAEGASELSNATGTLTLPIAHRDTVLHGGFLHIVQPLRVGSRVRSHSRISYPHVGVFKYLLGGREGKTTQKEFGSC